MKNIALLILGCIATPLILYSQLKGWHQRGEIFGFTVSPAIAQPSKQKLSKSEREKFVELLKKCQIDGSSLSDANLNQETLDCKRRLTDAS